MSDSKNIIAKIEIIKEMAPEKSVQQLADVVIDYIKSKDNKPMGFKK